jgi:hypothetical protein
VKQKYLKYLVAILFAIAVPVLAGGGWGICALYLTLPLALLYIASIQKPIPKSRGTTSGSPVCAKCGYDLRATPARCPECGTIRAEKT